jgi:hypothetical protein
MPGDARKKRDGSSKQALEALEVRAAIEGFSHSCLRVLGKKSYLASLAAWIPRFQKKRESSH